MNIKYNIQSIKNAQGNGKDREFVRLYENAPLSPRQLEEHIRNHTGLTPGALHGVLDTLGDCMAHALSEGTRFHLPGIGYFSLGARLDKPDGATDGKVRGNQIKVDGIKFRPEARLLARVKRNVPDTPPGRGSTQKPNCWQKSRTTSPSTVASPGAYWRWSSNCARRLRSSGCATLPRREY